MLPTPEDIAREMDSVLLEAVEGLRNYFNKNYTEVSPPEILQDVETVTLMTPVLGHIVKVVVTKKAGRDLEKKLFIKPRGSSGFIPEKDYEGARKAVQAQLAGKFDAEHVQDAIEKAMSRHSNRQIQAYWEADRDIRKGTNIKDATPLSVLLSGIIDELAGKVRLDIVKGEDIGKVDWIPNPTRVKYAVVDDRKQVHVNVSSHAIMSVAGGVQVIVEIGKDYIIPKSGGVAYIRVFDGDEEVSMKGENADLYRDIIIQNVQPSAIGPRYPKGDFLIWLQTAAPTQRIFDEIDTRFEAVRAKLRNTPQSVVAWSAPILVPRNVRLPDGQVVKVTHITSVAELRGVRQLSPQEFNIKLVLGKTHFHKERRGDTSSDYEYFRVQGGPAELQQEFKEDGPDVNPAIRDLIIKSVIGQGQEREDTKTITLLKQAGLFDQIDRQYALLVQEEAA